MKRVKPSPVPPALVQVTIQLNPLPLPLLSRKYIYIQHIEKRTYSRIEIYVDPEIYKNEIIA